MNSENLSYAVSETVLRSEIASLPAVSGNSSAVVGQRASETDPYTRCIIREVYCASVRPLGTHVSLVWKNSGLLFGGKIRDRGYIMTRGLL